MSDSVKNIIEFLCGSMAVDGYWWGEEPRDRRSKFWWRSNLREYDDARTKEIEDLKKVYNDLAESHAKQVIEIAKLNSDCDNYCTVMIAAAEEIKRVWESHCDEEGYGPQNLLLRLERGIPAQYGYTAGAFEADELKIKTLESELLKAKELIKKLLTNNIPHECINGWIGSELKFCDIRNGEGGQCYWCINLNKK